MLIDKIEKHLMEVQKPSRYIGGEVGSVVKDASKADVRFAFCFPDTYEIVYLNRYVLPYIKTTVYNDFNIDLEDNTHIQILLRRKG